MNTDLGLLKEMGERIRIIRSEMNLSKDALGKKIGVTGQFLGVVENGKSTMSYEKLKRLCDISGYTSDYILFGRKSEMLDETRELLKDFSGEQIQAVCEIIKKMVIVVGKENEKWKNKFFYKLLTKKVMIDIIKIEK